MAFSGCCAQVRKAPPEAKLDSKTLNLGKQTYHALTFFAKGALR